MKVPSLHRAGVAAGRPGWKLRLDRALLRNPFAPENLDEARLLSTHSEDDAELQDAIEEYGVLDYSKRHKPPLLMLRTTEEGSRPIRDLPFARYNVVQRAWLLPLMWISFAALAQHFPNVRLTPRVLEAVRRGWTQGRRELALLRYLTRLKQDRERYDDVIGYTDLQPRVYQQQAIKFIEAAWSLGYGIGLFDEQGIGKTCTALIAMDRYLAKRPEARVFVWAPKQSLYSVWVKEIVKFSKHMRPIVLDQPSIRQRARVFNGARYYDWCKIDKEGFSEYVRVRGEPNVFLVNHESASQRKRDRDDFEHNALVDAMISHPATFCVVDEVHKLMSKSASRTEGITLVSRACKYRLGMTGTPGLPHHLWAQLHFIDPRIFPVSLTAFMHRYVEETRVGHVVYRRKYLKKDELRTRMGYYSLRRTQREVLPELPPEVHEVVKIQLQPEQRKMYDELVEETITYFGDNPITKTSAAARTHALRNITGGHIKQDLGREGKKKLFKKHRLAQNAKLEYLMEMIEQETAVADIMEMDLSRKILVGCEYLEDVALISDALKDAKIRHSVITGDVVDKKTDKARTRAADRFVEDPGVQVLVGITSTFGISLNLVPRLPGICRRMVFFSSCTDPKKRDQAEKRILRSADTWEQLKAEGREVSSITFTDLVCENTYDETIAKGLRQNIDVSRELTGDNLRDMLMGVLPERKTP